MRFLRRFLALALLFPGACKRKAPATDAAPPAAAVRAHEPPTAPAPPREMGWTGVLSEEALKFPLDLIATPDEVLRPRHRKRPCGIVPGDLTPEVVAAIPALRDLGFR
jgi:hypothetical protein